MSQHQESSQVTEDLSMYQQLYDQFQSESVDQETGDLVKVETKVLSDAKQDIQKLELADFGDEGWLLKQFLTNDECQYIIDSAEFAGFKSIPGANNSYRSCQRIVFHDPILAASLYKRLAPFLSSIYIRDDPKDQHIYGPSCQLRGTTWEPKCLNPILRICRYTPGQHFAPHFDGHLVHSSKCRSLQTFMLYLTGSGDADDGGATNFLNPDQSLHSDSTGRFVAPSNSVLHAVHPLPGLAILFNHYRLHEGEQLKSGVKYILRTDVMYTCTSMDNPISANTELALKYIQEAERLESRPGGATAAVEFYRKAFKLCPELESCT